MDRIHKAEIDDINDNLAEGFYPHTFREGLDMLCTVCRCSPGYHMHTRFPTFKGFAT